MNEKIGDWTGEVSAADPDGLALEARYLPVSDAICKLEGLPVQSMRDPLMAHLRGEAGPGATWLYRRSATGATIWSP